MKKILCKFILVYYFLTQASLANIEIENLKSLITEKGATPLPKVEVDNDESYKLLLETQYDFILKEEINIIKDIKIAENSCKIMGYKPGFTEKNKKKFNTCVIEVWQARLVGKKFVSMQSKINTKDFTPEDLQKYFNDKLDDFNSVRNEQLKKNKDFKIKFEELGIKDKLEEVDYKKIVTYAIGIVAVYYISKTILDSLAEAKTAEAAVTSKTYTFQNPRLKIYTFQNPRYVSFCKYGKMIYARYRLIHPTMIYCNK